MTTHRPIRDLLLYCDRPSNAVTELANRLNSRRLYADPSRRLRSLAGTLCINYGTSVNPDFQLGEKSVLLNSPSSVAKAISKRVSYAAFRKAGVPTLDFTVDRSLASSWVRDGTSVLARRDGLSSGAGIVLVPKGSQDVPVADFYTRYFPKTHEYRVHVFGGSVIDITQKRLKNGASWQEGDTPESKIVRSLDNGWVHAHDGIHMPDGLKEMLSKASIDAIKCLGLDFGAVDILVQFGTKNTSKFYGMAVCEVNTAPGLGNEATIDAYSKAIKHLYATTAQQRHVNVVERPKRRRVQKMVRVQITTKKGNKVMRDRLRWVFED